MLTYRSLTICFVSKYYALIPVTKAYNKTCLNKPLDYHTKLIFSEFNVLKIEQIFKRKLLKYFHKNRLYFKSEVHGYSTRRNDNFFYYLNPSVVHLLD